MNAGDKNALPPLTVAALIAFLAVAGYWRILPAYFVAEDFLVIRDVVASKGGPNWAMWVEHLHSAQYVGTYRPIVTLAYTVQYALWGTSALGFHAASVAVHGFNAFWLYTLVGRLNPTRSPLVPLLAAVLFVSHPSHVEAVGYISALAGPLCVFFYLPALLLYLRFMDTGKSRWLWLSVAWFAFALGSKEEAVTLPLALVLLTLPLLERPLTFAGSVRAAARLLPYFALLAAYFAFRHHIFGYFTNPFHAATSFVLPETVRGALVYFAYLLAPVNRLFLGSYGDLLFRTLLTLALGGFGLLILRSRPSIGLLAFIWASILILLIPFWKGLHYGIEPGLTNSRYLYFPSAALIAGIAVLIGLTGWLETSRARLSFLVALVCAQIVLLNINNGAVSYAGAQSRYIQQEALRLTGHRAYVEIANMPDTVYGVLFDRSGFQHAFMNPFVPGNAVNSRERIVALVDGASPTYSGRSQAFTWETIENGQALSVGFRPAEARGYAVDLRVPNPRCGAHPETLRLVGRGTAAPPLGTAIAVSVLPRIVPDKPGEPFVFAASVSDLADGQAAEEVSFFLEPGVPWRLRYIALADKLQPASIDTPVRIPDGGTRHFMLELFAPSTPPAQAVVARIGALNAPLPMAEAQRTLLEVAPDGMGLMGEVRFDSTLIPPRPYAGPVETPCEIDFGTVPISWYAFRGHRPFVRFDTDVAMLFWDDASYRLLPWSEVERAPRVLSTTTADIERWRRSPEMSFIPVSPTISAFKATSERPWIETAEINIATAQAAYLVFRMRASGVPEPLARLSWKARADEPEDPARGAGVMVIPDGRWHIYAIPLHAHPAWRSVDRVRSLRFQPIASSGSVEIERFEVIGSIP